MDKITITETHDGSIQNVFESGNSDKFDRDLQEAVGKARCITLRITLKLDTWSSRSPNLAPPQIQGYILSSLTTEISDFEEEDGLIPDGSMIVEAAYNATDWQKWV